MSKKIINEELHRIQEIMGITPKVIKEQDELIKLLKYSSDADAAIARELDNVISRETRGSFNDIGDLFGYLERNATGETIDDIFPGLSRKMISSIANNPTFEKQFVNSVFKTQLDQTTLELVTKFKNKIAKPSDIKQLKSSIDATIDSIKTGNSVVDDEIKDILRRSSFYKKVKDSQVDEFLSPAEKTIAAAKQQSNVLGKFRLKFKDPDAFYASFKAKGWTDKKIIDEVAKKYSELPITYKKILEKYIDPTFKFANRYKWPIGVVSTIGVVSYLCMDYITDSYNSVSKDVKDRASTINGYEELNDVQKLFVITYAQEQIMNNQIGSFIADPESGGVKIIYKDGKSQSFTAEQIGKSLKVDTVIKQIDLEGSGDSTVVKTDGAAIIGGETPEQTIERFKKEEMSDWTSDDFSQISDFKYENGKITYKQNWDGKVKTIDFAKK